jgi:hypothetical protein
MEVSAITSFSFGGNISRIIHFLSGIEAALASYYKLNRNLLSILDRNIVTLML